MRNRAAPQPSAGRTVPTLSGGGPLSGGHTSPSHAVKNGRRYRYYTSQTHLQERRRPAPATRVSAHDIEALVEAELQALLLDPAALLDYLGTCRNRRRGSPPLPCQATR